MKAEPRQMYIICSCDYIKQQSRYGDSPRAIPPAYAKEKQIGKDDEQCWAAHNKLYQQVGNIIEMQSYDVERRGYGSTSHHC